ncbi:hypothetical protein STRAU_2675 [Streptomyces aurantiacus JA 4570]|uniref:Uncharacterized protein n=1 Tax=Streptomyces aurantiacus JA 4570 TaxID=1286094 RepID=S4A0J6_9ACTN|nr:hypothetical protein STRAU_2675 [Streptomyces aurantiacus JA 4570]
MQVRCGAPAFAYGAPGLAATGWPPGSGRAGQPRPWRAEVRSSRRRAREVLPCACRASLALRVPGQPCPARAGPALPRACRASPAWRTTGKSCPAYA